MTLTALMAPVSLSHATCTTCTSKCLHDDMNGSTQAHTNTFMNIDRYTHKHSFQDAINCHGRYVLSVGNGQIKCWHQGKCR